MKANKNLFSTTAVAAVLVMMTSLYLSAGRVVLVEEGRPQAVIVTADRPGVVAALAADELVTHIEHSTGVELAVRTESEAADADGTTRIFIGRTRAAAAIGLDTDDLYPDGFILKSDGGDFFILGREDTDPTAGYSRGSGLNGTLHGVYEMLERSLQARWLWPGELGTYVPRRQTVYFSAADETVEPALDFVEFRINGTWSQTGPEELNFSAEGREKYRRAMNLFARRQRLTHSRGRNQYYWVTHHRFHNQIGDRHPEFFKMNEAGERGHSAILCVSNPGLHDWIVNRHWNGSSDIMIGEADTREYCRCDNCMEWDQPQPEDFPNYVTSNRYARFAAAVRDLARQRNPDGDYTVNTFAYMKYMHAPTIDIDLSGVHIAFCPWASGFTWNYPMSEADHQLLLDTWRGWHDTGATLHYRPNKLLTGYVMPHLSTWQSGEMARFSAAHGSKGVDYDSLTGHWAARGPMYYIQMRLTVKPEKEIAELREEFFSAFGPAAEPVEAYFDYWEEYSRNEAAAGGVGRGRTYTSHFIYPPSAFWPAEDKLEQALLLAQQSDNNEYAARVAFLQAGLEHARLAAEFSSRLDYPGRAPTTSRERFDLAAEALRALTDFRREHEELFISSYGRAAGDEMRSYQGIERLLAGDYIEEKDVAGAPATAIQPWGRWFFRQDPDNIGVERQWFAATLDRSPVGLRVYDFDGQVFDIDESIWTSVRVPSWLSATAVGSYLGYGWYATTFTGPENWGDQPVKLYFGSVDEQAWIYVNGTYVGEHTVDSEGLGIGDLWNRPFAIEVPAGLIRENEENLLVIRMHASAGQAGIWGPVSAAPVEED